MKTYLLLFAGLLSAGVLCGQDLIESDFSGTDLANNLPLTATVQLMPGVSSSGWNFGPGIDPFDDIDDQLAFRAPSGATPSTLAEAVSGDQYLTITLTPETELALTEQRFSFTVRRFTYNASRRYSVFSSVAGFGEGDAIFTSELIASDNQEPVDLSFIIPDGHETVSGTIEFRIYVYEGQYSHPTNLVAFSITDPGEVFSLSASADSDAEIVVAPGSTYFVPGTSVEVMAIAPEGMRFAGWDGNVSSGFNPITVTMDADTAIHATFVPQVTGQMEVGTNMQEVNYWSTGWTFVDGMKSANAWVALSDQNQESPEVPVDENGWPLEVPFDPGDGIDYVIRTVVHVPMSGEMTVTFEGTGTIRFNGQNVVSGQAPLSGEGGLSTHQVEFALQPGIATSATMLIYFSDPVDPIRNIKIHMAGFDDSTTFHPDFLEDLEPYTTLRFMDWGDTNAHGNGDWAERTTPDNFTQGTGAEGVAIELMVELANTAGKDMWYCVPHLADDYYIEQAAILIRDQLGPHQKVYLEYSNETWNGSSADFLQTYWVRQQGQDLGFSADAREAGDMFQAMRAVRCWEIFKEVFAEAGPNRVVKVASGWAGSPATTRARLAHLANPVVNPNGTTADAIAIAPYFGRAITADEIAENGYPTADEIVTTRSLDAIELARGLLQQNRQIAANAGVRLIAYEGGQHFTTNRDTQDDETLIANLRAAQTDPRMGERYTEYFDMLRDEGIEFFANFTLTGPWGRSFFAIYEYQNQPLEDAPKAAAVLDWIGANRITQPSAPDLQIDLTAQEVQFLAEPGNFYTLETSIDLLNWEATDLQYVGGNTGIQTLSFDVNEDRRFWRVRVE